MKSNSRLAFELLGICCVAAVCVAFFQHQPVKQVETPPASLIPTQQTKLEFDGYKPSQSFQGLNLIPQSGSGQVLLVNMLGETVHKWDIDAQRARLLPNCNLLVVHGTKWGLNEKPWKFLRRNLREYTWDGKVDWEYIAPRKAHHDIKRLPNGNTLVLHRDIVPEQIKISLRNPKRRSKKFRADVLQEVTTAGDVVWEWKSWNHLDLNSCGKFSCNEIHQSESQDGEKNLIDWTHTNTISPLPENHWYDSGDVRFKPGNILIIPRNWSTILLIDRESKKIVWEYQGNYNGGLGGGHEAHMIKKGLPGAGNILAFDNGRENHTGSSYVLEIDPTTKELDWVFDAGTDFYSHAAGSVQRLPNGNTLISEDVPGRVMEVTANKKVVWKYKSEFRTCRAHRYEKSYCSKLAEFTD